MKSDEQDGITGRESIPQVCRAGPAVRASGARRAANFTALALQKLTPAARPYELTEAGRQGLRIRVFPTGIKSWQFVYRHAGKLHRIALGQFPAMGLKEAREELGKRRALLNRGVNPALLEREVKRAQREAPTVRELAEDYLERYAKGERAKRSWREDERILNKDVLPRWGEMKAKDVRRLDVVALLDEIGDRGAQVMARNTFAVVRKMFTWAVSRGVLEASPCFGVKAPPAAPARERVLKASEVCALWRHLDDCGVGPAHAGVLRLILVTAQRKGEVIGAEWSEFDLKSRWWTIPGAKAKNGKAHRVPLSPLALEVLQALPRVEGCRFLFPHRHADDQHMLMTSTDHALRRAESRAVLAKAKVGEFTPHDLRRTAASHMASLGVSRDVLARVLNHADRSVTAVYDRHSYDREKRAALKRWSDELRRLLKRANA
ncbi:MAG: tyrosine-type recombinase/integrase [Gammaproteobacteria bacterium]|nr:tyrosine-type recombinase/integrase [Gammaproteobacteria bacterium]